MNIRKSINADITEIINVHVQAFGKEKGPEIGQLVNDLFDDKTAVPVLSLVAVENGIIVGHILYTKVKIIGATEGLHAQILAPLAVLPEAQSKGVGVQLVNEGLNDLKKSGVKLVFVLGHPGYYPRCGFTPAGNHGYVAPYFIPEEHSGAWMVQELVPGIIGTEKGRIQCSDVLNKPEHWRE